MKCRLEPITSDNWETAVALTTDPERKIPLVEQWVANNAYSMLECVYDRDMDCRLLMDGETAVGFVFYGYDRDNDRHLLCRYMIDVAYQNKGYGTAFLPLVTAQIRSQYGCRDIYTTAHDDNTHACHLYTAFGFARTEEMDEDERVYVLHG